MFECLLMYNINNYKTCIYFNRPYFYFKNKGVLQYNVSLGSSIKYMESINIYKFRYASKNNVYMNKI